MFLNNFLSWVFGFNYPFPEKMREYNEHADHTETHLQFQVCIHWRGIRFILVSSCFLLSSV